MGLTNKKLGNSFEAEFCKMLSDKGYWAHNLAQNSSGQPADVIAARNGDSYLIDCKVCSGDTFDKKRIEDNQQSAMELWEHRGNNTGYFAIRMRNEIFMISLNNLLRCPKSTMNYSDMEAYGVTFEDWLWERT